MSRLFVILSLGYFLSLPVALAAEPLWWTNSATRIIDPNVAHAVSENYAPANLGQLKNIATNALAHLDLHLPHNAYRQAVVTKLAGFAPANGTNYSPAELAANYSPVNIGQVKAVAEPFYLWLLSAGYDVRSNLIQRGFPNDWPFLRPWNPATLPADNYTVANIGQLKSVFGFDASSDFVASGGIWVDTNLNNLADWWEGQFFSGITIASGGTVPDSGGMTYQQLYDWYIEQSQSSTVGDGIPDSWKQANGIAVDDPDAANKDPDNDGLSNSDEYDAQLNPQIPDYDGDEIPDGQDLYPKVANLSAPYIVEVAVPDYEAHFSDYQVGNYDPATFDFTKVELRWEASENSPNGYIIERRINSDIWQTLGTTSQLKYPDQGLLANCHYQYRVTAYKDINNQRVLSDSSIKDYEVPLVLSLKKKIVSSAKYKINYAPWSEFINPSTPPIYYKTRTTTSDTHSGAYQSTSYTQTTRTDYYQIGSIVTTISNPISTQEYIENVIQDLPDYPGAWVESTSVFNTYQWGNWGYSIGGSAPSNWTGNFKTVRNYDFEDEDALRVQKGLYKFTISPSVPYTMKWYEIFVPDDDLSTSGDESKQIEIVGERTWNVGASGGSQEFEIDEAVTRPQNGSYHILVQPAHISVYGVGEAGKDKAGDDTNPGKVALINDHDADHDGIPDYADGYDLSTELTEDNTCEDSSFTFFRIFFADVDSSHAKIRFTYDASDPKQITSTSGDPFLLPATGKLRLWKKDASVQRNGLPVKSGGDFIKPGVEYSFAELGINNNPWLDCYAELVKLSSSVADIPIKVEIDPTGSMGYVWSDQLRFTGTKIELRAKSYGENAFDMGALLQPSSLRDFEKNVSLFGRPPKNYNVFEVSIWDPRTNLTKVKVARSSLDLASVSGVWKSEPFVGVIDGGAEDYSGTETRVPITTQQQSIEYNPDGLTEVGRAKEVPRLVTEVDSIVQKISVKMKAAGWLPPAGTLPNDKGVFGDAVHEKTSDVFRPRKSEGFITDLWLAEDGTVLQHSIYNKIPDGGNGQTVQIDLIKVEKGYVPTVGDKLDKSLVQYVFDVKTSDRVRLTQTFKTFLGRVKALTGVETVWAPQVLEKWSVFRKVWETNKRVLRGIPYAKMLGAAGSVTILFSMNDAEAKFDQQMQLAEAWRTADKTGTIGERMSAKSLYYYGLEDLLNTVSIDPIGSFTNVYGLDLIMLADDGSVFEYDEEYDQDDDENQ